MTRYEPKKPRFALGVAALIMTTITVGALVVLPARMEPGDSNAPAVATRPSPELASGSIQATRHSATDARSSSASGVSLRLN